MDVTFVRWPARGEDLAAISGNKKPLLFLVSGNEEAPRTSDPLHDWIRLPASDEDIKVRVAGLVEAANGSGRATIDAEGVLRHGDRWTTIPPVEARLTAMLIERWGTVVARQDLAAAGWPQGQPNRNALDVHVLRLRRRVDEVGLVIRTIRNRGYLIETLNSA